MSYDPLFDSTQNQALLVICARKTIRGIGIGGLIWGLINLVFGMVMVRVTLLNLGLVFLALLMLGTGVYAMVQPSLTALLLEAIVSALLFCWNVGITTRNARLGVTSHVDGHGLIFPALAAFYFFREYNRLGHLKEAIQTIDAETVKQATAVCKELLKKKIKAEPDVAEAVGKKCRVQFTSDSVFCVQKGLTRAFHLSVEEFRGCLKDVKAKKLKLIVNHPLGKLTYAFDKKNSEKIKGWLRIAPVPAVVRA
jgi:hypothetical protein